MPRRRAVNRSRRRASTGGAGAACVVAVVALAGAMGVVVLRKDETRGAARAQVPAPIVKPVAVVREAPPPAAPAHTSFVSDQRVKLRNVEAALPQLKRMTRGPAFDKRQVDLLGKVTDARDAIGVYLDTHADDDRAQDLWDRVMRLYVALHKL